MAQVSDLPVRKTRCLLSVYYNLALGGDIDAAYHVEYGGFAAAGGAYYGDKVSFVNAERNPFYGWHQGLSKVIRLSYILQLYNWHKNLLYLFIITGFIIF